MKKILYLILASALISVGIMSCAKKDSKPKKDTKQEFLTQLELIVTKAENNNSQDRVPQLKDEYNQFMEQNPNITKSSSWTESDLEKYEDLVKRFSIATVTDTYSWTDDYNYDESEEIISDTDLGLDESLNFGDLGDLILGDLDLTGSSSSSPVQMDDLLGGLDLSGLTGESSGSSLDLGFSDLSVPSIDLSDSLDSLDLE